MRIVLGLVAALVTLLVAFQQLLTIAPSKPSGPLALVLAPYVGSALFVLVVLSSLILVSKARRNWRDFLKAYVAFGSLMLLGMCSSYVERFHGEAQTLASSSGLLQVTTPSDWAVTKDEKVGYDLATMDWAGAYGVNASILPDVSASEVRAAEPDGIETTTDAIVESMQSKLGPSAGRVECGTDCSLRRFDTTSPSGSRVTALVGILLSGERAIVLMGLTVGETTDDRLARVVEVLRTVRVASR